MPSWYCKLLYIKYQSTIFDIFLNIFKILYYKWSNMQLSTIWTIWHFLSYNKYNYYINYQCINVEAYKQHRDITKDSDGVATSHVSSQKQFLTKNRWKQKQPLTTAQHAYLLYAHRLKASQHGNVASSTR